MMAQAAAASTRWLTPPARQGCRQRAFALTPSHSGRRGCMMGATLSPHRRPGPPSPAVNPGTPDAVNADDLIALNEQIVAMARAGLPLDQGLAGLAGEMGRGRLRRVTEAIARDLRNGSTLPEAIERRKREMPPYYANLIAAGVRSGRLPEVLATLTTYARQVATTRTIVADSLFYPAVVFLFALGLIAALVFSVLPQFEQIFRAFGMRLPWITEVALAVGRQPVPVFVVPAGLLVIGLFLVWAV